MDDINDRIRFLRKKHGLSMAKLAQVIGVSPGNISDWESKKKKSTPTAKALASISNYFNVSLEWLIKGNHAEEYDPYHQVSETMRIKLQHLQQTALSLPEEDVDVLNQMADRLYVYSCTQTSHHATRLPQSDSTDRVREASEDAYYVRLPVIGRITAGDPITAIELVEEYVPVPKSLVRSGKHFVLRVQGESMKNAGIRDQDLVVIRYQSSAENGEIVAALIDGEEATIKTFYREQDRVRLQPENDSMLPIYTTQVRIMGKVIGILKGTRGDYSFRASMQ